MAVLSMSKQEFSRLEVLLRVQSGRLRVADACELAFAKLKALLRAKAIRTVEALWKELGSIVDCFTPQECANFFRHAGYFQSP